MSEDPEVRHYTVEALAVAREALAGTLRPLLAARWLTPCLHFLNLAEDDRFIPLRGVDSEADRAPLEEGERWRWDPALLARADAHYAEYEERVRGIVLDACASLVAELESRSVRDERDA